MPASKLFGIIVGFLLLTLVKCQEICGVSNLPPFRDTEHFQGEGLINRISAIVPSYTFTCSGVVRRWRAHVERRRNRYDRYELTFSVWRPADGCTYDKVGENNHSGLAPELDGNGEALGSVTLDVREEDRFSVEPGDFVGFSVRHYEVDWPSDREIAEGAASVMVDLNRTDISTYAWITATLPSTLPCMREGVTSINITAAPVILVDMIPATNDTSTALPVPTTTTASSVELTSQIVGGDISSGPVITTTPPNEDTRHTTVPQTLFIIPAACLLAVAVVLLIVFFICVCIRRQKRKSPNNLDSEEPENEYMEMMRSHAYNNNTILEKRQGRLQFRSIYDTLTPEPPQPLPQLNPTLCSFSATDRPNFLSHSETPATSTDSDLFLLSSTSPSTPPPTGKQQRQESIECPLYSSLVSPTQKEPVLSEGPEYSSLCSPDEPTYDVPSLPSGTGYENPRCKHPPPPYSTEAEAEYETMN